MSATSKNIKRTKFVGLEAINFAIRPLHTSLISLLVIRLIDIDLWGSFVFYLLAIELFTMVLNWGQRAYLMREFSLQPQNISRLLSTTFLARIPLFVGAIVVLILVPDFKIYFWSLLVWLIFKWLANLFESLIKFNRTYWHSIIAEVFALCVAIGYLFFHYQKVGLQEVIFAFAISSIVRFIILSPLLKNLEKISFTWNDLMFNLKVAFPLLTLSIAGLLQAKGDLYTAAYFLADADLAEYQVIVSFLILGQTIAWIILGPFQKNIYRWKEGDLNPLKRKFVGLGVLISSVFSVSLYFGLKLFYQIQLPNWYPFLFFAAIFPMYLYLIENQILLKYKQENQLFKFSILSGAISVGMAILLIPTFGITGALIGSVLGSAVVVVLVLYRFKKIIN